MLLVDPKVDSGPDNVSVKLITLLPPGFVEELSDVSLSDGAAAVVGFLVSSVNVDDVITELSVCGI